MSVPMHSERGWEMLSRRGIRAVVGWVYSFWAGAINAVTMLAIYFEAASHISGRLHSVGVGLVLHPIDALLVFLIWFSFVLGGFLGGKLLDRVGFTPSLLLIAGGTAFSAFLVWQGFYVLCQYDYTLERLVIASALPLAMGFQNSVTSQLPVGRTTHWTGDSTDIGIALAKGNFPLAIYNLIKIFGFVCGAATSGYVIGIVGLLPLYTLLLVAAGFALSTLILHGVNSRHKSSNSN